MGDDSEPQQAPAVRVSPYERALASIAQGLYRQTRPLRRNLISQYRDILSGQWDPQTSPLWAQTFSAGKQGIEHQYGMARENVLSSMPRGGVLQGELANVERGRAETAGRLPAEISKSIMDDQLAKIYGVAWNAPQQSMAGLGSAAGTYGNRQNVWQNAYTSSLAQQNAAQAQMYSSLGQGVGLAMGAALK